MTYQNLAYKHKQKIEALLNHEAIKTSAKLSHLLEVSRNSIVNWCQNDETINEYKDIEIEPIHLPDNFFYDNRGQITIYTQCANSNYFFG